MMMANQWYDIAQCRYGASKLRTLNWMSSHYDLLFGREAAGLAQNGTEDFMNFADVMQQGGSDHPLYLFLSQPNRASNQSCLFRDSARMSGCVGVSSLNGSHHQLK